MTRIAGSVLEMPSSKWMINGICNAGFPDWWFPDKRTPKSETQHAINICNRCPVLEQCFQYAMRVDVEGIWGATTYEQRRTMRRRLGMRAIKNEDSYRYFKKEAD